MTTESTTVHYVEEGMYSLDDLKKLVKAAEDYQKIQEAREKELMRDMEHAIGSANEKI